MKREEIIEQGMRLLSDVHDDEHFRTVDGKTLKSVRELVLLLETYRDEHFQHHVNEHRNDFAQWVEFSVKDPKLAERVRAATSAPEIQQAIADRLEELESQLVAYEHTSVYDEPTEKEPSIAPPQVAPEPLLDEHPDTETIERDDLLEEIEKAIAQARAQLEIERAQEVREPEDLSGEPEQAVIEEDVSADPVKRAEPTPPKTPKRETARNAEPKADSGFSLKDFFIGFAFGALIGGVLGAIIGLMLL